MRECKNLQKTDREEESERSQVNKSSVGRGAAGEEDGTSWFCIESFFSVFFF